jgi:hypothetical protein
MNKIPLTSQFSLSEGLWLIFSDGNNKIAAHNSNLGQESVFFNDKLVSENKSLSKKSTHKFNFKGESYTLTFSVIEILTGKIECSLTKNSVEIGRFLAYCKYNINFKNIPFILIFILSFTSVFIPLILPFILIWACFLIFDTTKKSVEVIIDKTDI